MKTLLALFGLLVLLILAVLTGGLGVLFVLIGSETMRDAFRKVIDEFLIDHIYSEKK